MAVPMCVHSQRSRNICTGVMKPCRLPSAHIRVPMRNRVTGITRADDDAIRPNVTMPFENA